jgi:triacylglycerol lipase
MSRPGMIRVLSTLIALATTCAVAGPAQASDPGLEVSHATVVSGLHCTGDLDGSAYRPVLFLHGITSDSQANWSWNWDRALDARLWAHCDLDLPQSGNGDIQVAAEYVTRAIRIMHREAGRRISLVGHSQGGMIARWSLKYWPDTRAMVDDYVGLASSNHGTDVFKMQCELLTRCTAANWQQRTGSAFLTALNSGPETWPGISYTEIATEYDEVVVPYTSPYLQGDSQMVTNTTVQALCPGEMVDHFGMAYDNAAWLIGLDALTQAGPARLDRVDRASCGRALMPGVDPLTFATDVAAALAHTAQSSATATQLTEEPPLRADAR